MRVGHHKARFTPSVSRIYSQEDWLDPAVAEMLVNHMTLSEDFHFQIDAIGELGAIGGEFQPVIGVRSNVIYLAPDPAIAVLSLIHISEPTRLGMISYA